STPTRTTGWAGSWPTSATATSTATSAGAGRSGWCRSWGASSSWTGGSATPTARLAATPGSLGAAPAPPLLRPGGGRPPAGPRPRGRASAGRGGGGGGGGDAGGDPAVPGRRGGQRVEGGQPVQVRRRQHLRGVLPDVARPAGGRVEGPRGRRFGDGDHHQRRGPGDHRPGDAGGDRGRAGDAGAAEDLRRQLRRAAGEELHLP